MLMVKSHQIAMFADYTPSLEGKKFPKILVPSSNHLKTNPDINRNHGIM